MLAAVVVVTTMFSFVQEAKSADIMASFARLTPPACKVLRDGRHVVAAVAGQLRSDIGQVKARLHVYAPQAQRQQLRALWLARQRNVHALLEPPPQRLVQVPGEVGRGEHDDVRACKML